jgi:hypothetical protein
MPYEIGGTVGPMDESSGPCDFPLCSRSSIVMLRLLVEGDESILTACDGHADWLRRYAEEDEVVEVLDAVPQGSPEQFGEDDLAEMA